MLLLLQIKLLLHSSSFQLSVAIYNVVNGKVFPLQARFGPEGG